MLWAKICPPPLPKQNNRLAFLDFIFCFLLLYNNHVMLPQRTVSFKCHPIHVFLCIFNEQTKKGNFLEKIP